MTLYIALICVTIWAIVAELRLRWLYERMNELTDIVLTCGKVVTETLDRIEDDGR